MSNCLRALPVVIRVSCSISGERSNVRPTAPRQIKCPMPKLGFRASSKPTAAPSPSPTTASESNSQSAIMVATWAAISSTVCKLSNEPLRPCPGRSKLNGECFSLRMFIRDENELPVVPASWSKRIGRPIKRGGASPGRVVSPRWCTRVAIPLTSKYLSGTQRTVSQLEHTGTRSSRI